MEANQLRLAIIVSALILLIFFAAIILFLLQYYKRKIVHEKEKAEMEELHRTELLNTQLEVQQQTMQHIGREIHDNVGQKLTLATIYTHQLGLNGKSTELTSQLENISNIISESLTDLRKLSKTLTQSFENTNFIDLLKTECEKINSLKVCNVEFSSNIESILMPGNIGLFILRMLQEFMQNSLKHSECKTIFVTIEKNDQGLNLCAKDDGKGFAINQIYNTAKGIGLKNIKKRAELIGASMDMQSIEGSGTTLFLALPENILHN
jgi:signal transduction histidine kinase